MAVLTNTAIDALPKGKELKDDRISGLLCRRNETGVSWLLYYRTRTTGKVRRPKVGDYPTLSIAKAREIAKDMLGAVAAGRDPVLERQLAKAEPTMDELWDRCEEHLYNRGKQWDAEAKKIYDKNIKPHIGTLRVRAVNYAEVKAIHTAMEAAPFYANRTIAVLGRMFKEAERWGLRDEHTNPCSNIARYKEPSRRRFASPDEIAKIGPIIDRIAAEKKWFVCGAAFLYCLMFSGARPSEIERATPDMLERVERDGETYGVLRIDKGKTGQRNVFLPPQAMALFAQMPDDRKFLIGKGSHRFPRKLWEMVREEAGCGDLWGRDLRRTFATVALSNGVSLSQLGELLGHKSAQTTKIYGRLIEDSAHDAAAVVAGLMDGMLKTKK